MLGVWEHRTNGYIPVTVVISAEGKLADNITGSMDEDTLRNLIVNLL